MIYVRQDSYTDCKGRYGEKFHEDETQKLFNFVFFKKNYSVKTELVSRCFPKIFTIYLLYHLKNTFVLVCHRRKSFLV